MVDRYVSGPAKSSLTFLVDLCRLPTYSEDEQPKLSKLHSACMSATPLYSYTCSPNGHRQQTTPRRMIHVVASHACKPKIEALLYNRMLICACTRRTCICGNRESLPRALIIYALHSSLKNVDMIGCNNNKYAAMLNAMRAAHLSLARYLYLSLSLSLSHLYIDLPIYIYLFTYRFYEYIYIYVYRACAGGFEPTTRMQSAWLILLGTP